jgi:hypothetical protein
VGGKDAESQDGTAEEGEERIADCATVLKVGTERERRCRKGAVRSTATPHSSKEELNIFNYDIAAWQVEKQGKNQNEALPMKKWPNAAEGPKDLALAGGAEITSKEEFNVLNLLTAIGQPERGQKSEHQNFPMKEKQNTDGGPQRLPLVGNVNSQTLRKEPRRRISLPVRFQDHSVLESKPYFSIILRLENAEGDSHGSWQKPSS